MNSYYIIQTIVTRELAKPEDYAEGFSTKYIGHLSSLCDQPRSKNTKFWIDFILKLEGY
jgi:hypothetical protein